MRFAMPFDLERVLRVEALLFPSTGLMLLWLMRRQPTTAGHRRNLQWVLVAAFALAGLRSALWALGIPVMVANATVLATALVGLGAVWRRRRTVRAGS